MKEKFPNSRKSSHRWVCGEFCNLRGQHNWEREKKKKTKPTEYAAASREVAQTLASASREQGLNREARVACLGQGPGLNILRTI